MILRPGHDSTSLIVSSPIPPGQRPGGGCMKPQPIPAPLRTGIRDPSRCSCLGIRVVHDPAPTFAIRMTPDLLRMARGLLSLRGNRTPEFS